MNTNRRHRLDNNQPGIILALRRRYYSVMPLQSGADFLVGYRGMNFLFELKDPDSSKQRQRLTPIESAFHRNWRGQITTVTTIEEIIKIIGKRIK